MDILMEPLMDSLKTLPILFIAFLVVEYLSSKNVANRVLSHDRFGPVMGAILGSIPQCGFSVVASQLYGFDYITMGTLLAVFMATSDEAIPIMVAYPHLFKMMILLIFAKLIVGAITGMIVDIHNKKEYEYIEIEDCTCGCTENFVYTAIRHTIKIFIYILLTNFIMTLIIEAIGEDQLINILNANKFLQPIIAGFVGFIPNCAGSVILTQLYVSNALSFGALFTGLTTSAGVGTIALLTYSKNMKNNIRIYLTSYIVALIIGYIFIIVL